MKPLFNGKETLIENKTITNNYLMSFTKLKSEKRKFSNCIFQSCRWEQSSMDNLVFEDCVFKGCTFDNSDFSNSKFINTKFIKCTFNEFTWYSGYFKKVSFKSSNIKGSKFDDVEGKYISIVDSKLGSVELRGKELEIIVVKNCVTGLEITGIVKNINISNLQDDSSVNFRGDLANIVIENCKKLYSLTAKKAQITNLEIHNIDNIGHLIFDGAKLYATDSNKPNTITNSSMNTLIMNTSEINNLNFVHSFIEKDIILEKVDLNNVKLKNMKYGDKLEVTTFEGINYQNSDHFPAATEKR